MSITALKLLNEAAKRGWSFTVDQGDDDGPAGPIYSGRAAWEAVKDVGEADVMFYDAAGACVGWAYLMAPGKITCSPEESLVNYSCGEEGTPKHAFQTLCDALIDEVF